PPVLSLTHPAPPEISPLSLHDALPILLKLRFGARVADMVAQESEDKSLSWEERKGATITRLKNAPVEVQMIGLADKLSNMRDIDRDYPVLGEDRKSTRLNSSHVSISYAVFCLKK